MYINVRLSNEEFDDEMMQSPHTTADTLYRRMRRADHDGCRLYAKFRARSAGAMHMRE
jgi:hypothetical protein